MANVLIVDDDVEGCRPLVRLLQYVGHRPFFVHDGRAALTMLDQLRPDMILLDVMMPGLNGMDVLKHIRQHPMHKNLPVVVYSALSDAGTINNAMQSGAQSYLVKSKASFSDIQECIESHLADNGHPTDPAPDSPHTDSPHTDSPDASEPRTPPA